MSQLRESLSSRLYLFFHRLAWRRFSLCLLLGTLLAFFSAYRLLPRFLYDLTGDDPLNKVYYTNVEFFGGVVEVPRPSTEVRSELQKLAGNQSSDANLYRLLSEQDERILDLPAAESHLKEYVERSADKSGAYGLLAGFFEKHLRFDDAVSTLLKQVSTIQTESPQLSLQDRPRYQSLHHAMHLVETRKLGSPDVLTLFRKLTELYPDQALAHKELLSALLNRKQHGEALDLLEKYRQRFPRDTEYALLTQAKLLEGQGNPDAAIHLYARNYQPRWSDSLLNGYLSLLKRTHKFEAFVQTLGQELKSNPTDFASATLLFRGTLNQGNLEAARNVLFHFRSQKESLRQPFSDEELETLAHYFYSLNHFNEAARYFSTLALQTQKDAKKEEGLFQLHRVMLDALNRPTQLGGGSLKYFQSVAMLDTNPGVLNGMLSLILNRSHPRLLYDGAEESAVSYFNRARAAELLEAFEKSYPRSAHLPRMRYQSLEVLKDYGRWETITQRGAEFLDRYPDALETPAVGMLMADAFANLKNSVEEFKVYDRMLNLLNSRPHRLIANPQKVGGEGYRSDQQAASEAETLEETRPITPLNPAAMDVDVAPAVERDRDALETARLQAIDYSYVLERNTSRLTAAKRYVDAVTVYRKELERNPDDEGLYARFAEYLNQHRFFNEEMEAYQQAITRFNKSTWYDKLARWYLRQKRQADFAALSKQFVDAFKGTELEEYFAAVVSQVRSNPFYEELNLYANRRFPHNLVFARNLAVLYSSSSKTFPQWESIAQRYFFEDKQTRERYYGYLSRRGRLQPMLAELAALQQTNLAQTRFLADVLAWRSDFEQALPHYQSLAARYPTDPETINLASDLLRSLGANNPRQTVESAKLRENLVKWNPDDRTTLTTIGETYAEIEAYPRARQTWLQIPTINVGDAALHLEAATLFWDYYLFEDALKSIQAYRRIANHPAAMAYELGAIYEDRHNTSRVIEEYVTAAALGGPMGSPRIDDLDSGPAAGFLGGGDERAYRRLRFLALRRKLGGEIDAEFRKRVQPEGRENHVALAYSRFLQNLNRFDDLRKFLLEQVATAQDRDFLNRVQPWIQQHGFYEVQEAGLKRQIELASIADQRLSVELELARFYESRKRVDDARTLLERLHSANPKSLGLIQDLQTFYWRNDLRDQAVALLERTIPLANTTYRRQFVFEEAQKLRALKQYDGAVNLAQQLLKEVPLDSSYADFVAQTLVLAKRNVELPAFYQERLQVIRQSSLGTEEKKNRILLFRRSMIDAQVALGDFAAALDQYIEILNLASEDPAVVTDAGNFAREHQLETRLRDYYRNAAQESPKDHRWPLLLARFEEHWGRLGESVQQYDATLRLRPERIDLYESKAALQQRLLDFPSAIQTLDRLYDLSYRNPAYLLNVADLQARLGNKTAALGALKKAYAVDAGLPAPQYFKVAEQLSRWGFLDEAKPYIDEGWKRFTQRSASDYMGDRNLLKPAVEVSVQRRDAEKIFTTLLAEHRRLAGIKGQPGGAQAEANQEVVNQAFVDLGGAIDKYFSPEEKSGFQTFFEKLQPPLSLKEKETLGLKVAQAARLAHLQESLLITLAEGHGQLLTGENTESDSRYRMTLSQLIEFYRRRQAYEKASVSLMNLWEQNPQKQRLFSDLVEPALAARKLGNATLELSILEKYAGASGGLFNPAVLQRYYQLLVEQNQDARIIQISQRDTRLIPALVNALIDRSNLMLARSVVQNYGQRKTSVWTTTQLAMTGAYLKDSTPQVAAAFNSVLNLKPIGELIRLPADESRLLYGAEWYFYTRRFGEHLYSLKNPQAEEFLSAQIEFAPVSSARQSQLGEFYLSNSELGKSQTVFGQALELEPGSGPALDGQAVVWMKQGESEKAIGNWLKLLAGQERQFSLPELQRVLRRVREFKLEASFRQPIETFLKTYVKRNQTYGIEDVLLPALDVFISAEEKVALLRTLAGQTQAFPFVERLFRLQQIQAQTLPMQGVYEVAIEWQRDKLKELAGDDRNFQLNQLIDFELGFAEYLLKSKGETRAESLLAMVQQDSDVSRAGEVDLVSSPVSKRIQFLRAQLLLQTNRADEAKGLLQSVYRRKEPIQSRQEDYLRAVDLLRQAKLPAAARSVRAEFYQELMKSDPRVNAHAVGLAEVYLEDKHPLLALAALEQMMNSQVDNQEGFRLAAELLWKYRSTKLDNSNASLGGKARETWKSLLKLNPAMTEVRLQLAEAVGKTNLAEAQNLLKSVIDDRRSTYVQKVEAARIAGKTGAQGLSFASAELRTIADMEAQRYAPKGATAMAASPQPPSGFYGPVYALRPPVAPGATPSLEALQQALYLRPLTEGSQDALNSRLFAELIKRYHRARKLSLLIDLFEQYGTTRRMESSFEYQSGPAEEGTGLLNDSLVEPGGGFSEPPPLMGFSLTSTEKVALLKAAIDAYAALEDYRSAAQMASDSSSIAASSREEFRRQARELDLRARQVVQAWAGRLSVNDTLGEELSQRKPISRARRGRVRS